MHSIRTTLAAAALLLGPAIASAQLAPPAGYFSGATRAWTLHGCGSGIVGWDDVNHREIDGPAFCVDGIATLGHLAGGTADDLVLTFADPVRSAAAVAGGAVFGFNALSSDVAVSLGASCSGQASCTTAFGLHPLGGPPNTAGISMTFLSPLTTPGYDFATFDVLGMYYGAFEYLPGHDADLVGAQTYAGLSASAVPEPATLALTLGGLAVLGAGAWRRRTNG